jgi:hypothetical protein
MFLKEYSSRGGRTLIVLGHFIRDPERNAEARPENDLANLPQELRSRVIIPSADEGLRRVMEARGFFTIEAVQEAYLMERQFPDGVLSTEPLHFGYAELDIPCA